MTEQGQHSRAAALDAAAVVRASLGAQNDAHLRHNVESAADAEGNNSPTPGIFAMLRQDDYLDECSKMNA